MALEVGIVGLPGAGKTTLFTALTRTGGGGFGKENVGMASIADDRLEALAELVGARRSRPRRCASSTCPDRAGAARRPAPGRRDPRGRRRLLARRRPARDLETLELELLVADRDHVERRLERVEKQAKSGDAELRKEVEQLQALLAHLEAGNSCATTRASFRRSSSR